LRLWQWTVIPADAPIIGVSYDTAWHARIGVSITNYEVAVTTAGGRILELRPESADAESILNQIDALMLTGGGDINPELYNGDASSAQLVDAARDDFELELIRGALKRDMPILGICRGIQIINVAQGGTLRNLRDDAIHSQTHNIGINSLAAHDVELTSDSKIAQMMGVGSCAVNSFHGQAVDKVGRQLVVTARASDGVIECLEMPSQTFVVCTQWHPEIPLQQTVMFEQLISEAKKYRANRKQISK
jgi:putative glutamine amidotransferase